MRDTAEAVLEIRNRLGMHARAATRFVQTANHFRADVWLEKDGQRVNGKSIMGVLMLVAVQGARLRLRAEGPDAAEALAALTALVESKFGEE